MPSGDDEFTRDRGPKYRGPAHSSPYAISRLGAPMDLVNTAREIEKADETIRHHVSSRLKIIAEQMQFLKEQAREVLESAQRDADLHRAKCQFKKRVGQVYHLYRKDDGSTYFSMLSAADWKGQPPDAPLGSYRLEGDMSWTPAEEVEGRDHIDEDVKRLLGS